MTPVEEIIAENARLRERVSELEHEVRVLGEEDHTSFYQRDLSDHVYLRRMFRLNLRWRLRELAVARDNRHPFFDQLLEALIQDYMYPDREPHLDV